MTARVWVGMVLRHSKVRTLFKWGLTALILGAVLTRWEIPFDEILGNLQYPFWLVGALIIPILVIPIIRVSRWSYFLHLQGVRESPWLLYKVAQLACFWGLMLPAGSGNLAVSTYLLERRSPKRRGVAGSMVIFETGLGLAVVLILGLSATIFGPDVDGVVGLRFTMLSILVLTGISGAVVVHRRACDAACRFIYRSERLGSVGRYLEDLHRALVAFPLGRALAGGVVLIALFQLATIGNVALLFRAFNYPLPFYVHLMFMPMIYIASIIPVTIQGFGLREGGFLFLYGLVSVPPSVAFAVSLLNFVLLTLLPALVGALIFLINRNEDLRPSDDDHPRNMDQVVAPQHPKA